MSRKVSVPQLASGLKSLSVLGQSLVELGPRSTTGVPALLQPATAGALVSPTTPRLTQSSLLSSLYLDRASTLGLHTSTTSAILLPTQSSRASSHWSTAPILRGPSIAAFKNTPADSSSDSGGWDQGHQCNQRSRSLVYLSAAAAAVAAASSSSAAAKQIPLNPIPTDVVLYQYEACPFCNKVKAYLDYHSIPYRVVEVNPLTRKEIKWSEYKKVPILVVDGDSLVDSSAIISTLQDRLNPASDRPTQKDEEGTFREEEAKWRKWVDDHLVHLLSPNIYRSPSEALEAFDYITTNGNFGTLERAMARYAGATTMYFIGKKLKKKHSIDDERQSLYSALNEWVDAVGSRKFLGGSKPNLADLAVFGVLRPIRNMKTGRDMIENTKIGQWYTNMEEEVGSSARLPEPKK